MANPNYVPPAAKNKSKGGKDDLFNQFLMQSISGYGQVIANGGSAAGINSWERGLVGSLGGMLGGMAGGGIPGAMIQLGFSFLQGEMLSKFQKRQTPQLVEVVNFPDPVKMWTLPSSAYTQPIGIVNRGLVQHNNNTVNVMAGPKVADNVTRALFDQTIYDQYNRRLI